MNKVKTASTWVIAVCESGILTLCGAIVAVLALGFAGMLLWAAVLIALGKG